MSNSNNNNNDVVLAGATGADTLTIDLGSLTLDTTMWNTTVPSYTVGTGVSTWSSVNNITITSGAVGSSGTYTIGNINNSTYSWNNTEWVDCMPQLSRIEQMCEKYPALEIAFKNFKTIYELVKDDYDSPKDSK